MNSPHIILHKFFLSISINFYTNVLILCIFLYYYLTKVSKLTFRVNEKIKSTNTRKEIFLCILIEKKKTRIFLQCQLTNFLYYQYTSCEKSFFFFFYLTHLNLIPLFTYFFCLHKTFVRINFLSIISHTFNYIYIKYFNN